MNQNIIEEAEKEFIKLLDGKALHTKQLTEVAEHYFIVGYKVATEKRYSEEQLKLAYMQAYNRGVLGTGHDMESYIEFIKQK